MEPFRAFVGDNLPDEQRATGYAMQSFFIGLGAVLASALPWILTNAFHVANTAPAGHVPDAVRIAFYTGGAGLLLSVMWTVFTTKEYSPDKLRAFEASERRAAGFGAHEEPGPAVNAYIAIGVGGVLVGLALAFLVWTARLEKELYVLAVLLLGFGAAGVA
ncbi:MFS transporter, partial [Bradyrhizobium canariense]|uniref:SLC45 family MFS transporter n=1 Tax=Bradyrhizobium canariense TaxID=255045 RepID=UPI000A240245